MQPQLGGGLLDVAGVVEVGLEREHELLVAALDQVADALGEVALSAVGGSAVSSRWARRSSQRVTSRLGRLQRGERVPVRARGVTQILDRLALADVHRGVGREHAAQRLRELLAAAADPFAATTTVARPPTSPHSACLAGARARKRSSASDGAPSGAPTQTSTGRCGR